MELNKKIVNEKAMFPARGFMSGVVLYLLNVTVNV